MNIHGGNHIQITAYVDCTRRRPRRCYYGDEVNDPAVPCTESSNIWLDNSSSTSRLAATIYHRSHLTYWTKRLEPDRRPVHI